MGDDMTDASGSWEGESGLACWRREGTQRRCRAGEPHGCHSLLSLWTYFHPPPLLSQGSLVTTENFFPPWVLAAAPGSGQCFLEESHLSCMCREHSFRREQVHRTQPGDEALGPALPVGTLRFRGCPSSLFTH